MRPSRSSVSAIGERVVGRIEHDLREVGGHVRGLRHGPAGAAARRSADHRRAAFVAPDRRRAEDAVADAVVVVAVGVDDDADARRTELAQVVEHLAGLRRGASACRRRARRRRRARPRRPGRRTGSGGRRRGRRPRSTGRSSPHRTEAGCGRGRRRGVDSGQIEDPPPGSARRAESVAQATDPPNLIRLIPVKEAGRVNESRRPRRRGRRSCVLGGRWCDDDDGDPPGAASPASTALADPRHRRRRPIIGVVFGVVFWAWNLAWGAARRRVRRRAAGEGPALRGVADPGRARAVHRAQAGRGAVRGDGRGGRVDAHRQPVGRRHAAVRVRPGRGRRARLRLHALPGVVVPGPRRRRGRLRRWCVDP